MTNITNELAPFPPITHSEFTRINLNWSTGYTFVGEPILTHDVSTSMNTITEIQKPTIIYFRSDHTITPKCQGKIREEFDFDWTCPSTWSELAEALQTERDAFLAIHVDMLTSSPVSSATEFMDALATITKFMPCHGTLRIGVVIAKDTPRSVIKELQKTQCQGILLDIKDYSINEVNMAMNALYNRIPYWPKHVLDELPGAMKKATSKPGEIKLTPRQEQILTLIRERGASNKVIAKTLNITESTVKLHVGLVLKKFGVKNRTQLALFSKQ